MKYLSSLVQLLKSLRNEAKPGKRWAGNVLNQCLFNHILRVPKNFQIIVFQRSQRAENGEANQLATSYTCAGLRQAQSYPGAVLALPLHPRSWKTLCNAHACQMQYTSCITVWSADLQTCLQRTGFSEIIPLTVEREYAYRIILATEKKIYHGHWSNFFLLRFPKIDKLLPG